jgi:hypothetical protein
MYISFETETELFNIIHMTFIVSTVRVSLVTGSGISIL